MILLLIKVDFRLEPEVYCCSDDFDYFSHAETIAVDFDFNYDNQLGDYKYERFYKNNKSAPLGFVGSGLLAAPFLFIGNLLDKFVDTNQFVSFKLFLYSFSSILYLLFSIHYLLKIKNIIYPTFKNIHLIILFLGSGISYYAFERFSMTHVYEVFTVTMISYFSIKSAADKDGKNKNLIYLSLFTFLSLNVRWVNYFIFLIPIFLPQIINKEKFNPYKYKIYNFSNLFFLILTLFINSRIYGKVTLNPNYVYSSGVVDNSLWIFNDIAKTVKSFFIILFSQEFGIFYFSPILFLGLIISIILFFNSPKNIPVILCNLSFFQIFIIVVIWQSTAASYGYRYLLCLTPIALILFLDFYKKLNLNFKNVILNFALIISVFSFFSTLFFETTYLTQLSIDEQINSFGTLGKYTQPQYLKGYIYSVASLNAYLKIFTTSFLGLVFFNIIFNIISPEIFFNFLSSLGLNMQNDKTVSLLSKYESINEIFIILSLLFVFLIFKAITKFINLKN